MKPRDILKPLAKLGLPILGAALGGPAGAAVGKLLGDKLAEAGAVEPGASTNAIVEAITTNAEAYRIAKEFEQREMQMLLDALKASDAGQVELIKGDQQKSLYDRGWRPGAAWLCVFGMAYTFGLRPLLPWTLKVLGVEGVPELPAIDTTELFVMLGGLLGLGTMRHIERVKGKA